ncbi:MAG: UDP-N-acetylmuramoyl-L-alanine--D-glutamate ligase [Candidatus Buchananbacteria bacterium]|nr:UDP-N-acetylmuramoyl-L-alanine--D-glutamate ligase [Candidatus Buchananbacteria bacterium]
MLDFKNKKVTVMGLGLHGGGVSVAKFLAKKGAKVTVTDLKTKTQLEPSIKKLKRFKIKYVLGKHNKSDFKNPDMIIQNPGVPGNSEYLKIARQHNIPIETDLTLFFKLCPSQEIIGITGTKGKSTTTKLIHEIIRKYKSDAVIGGNIRISPLESLSKIKPDTPVVLELSSWQLEGLGKYKLSPRYAVVTNILRDHLNTYNGPVAYRQAKELIFKNQAVNDFLVLNKDNQETKQMAKRVKSNLYWFSKKNLNKTEKGCYVKKDWIIIKDKIERQLLNIKNIKLQGEHNLANVLAACTLTYVFGLPFELIAKTVKGFKGIEGRLQLIRQHQGIKYYNDTTATAPDAVIAALNSFEKPVVLLAGGTDKKLEFKQLARAIKKQVKALILFEGTATDKLIKELNKIKFDKTLIIVDSMREAFSQAKYILESGDIFLLSPGAASFGLFVNEFDRGEQFNKQVKKLS